jgi:hypothetical protein
MGNYYICVLMGKVFKNLFNTSNYWARMIQIYIKAFWGSAESKFKNRVFGGNAVGATLAPDTT